MSHNRTIPQAAPAGQPKWLTGKSFNRTTSLCHGFSTRHLGDAGAGVPAALPRLTGARRVRLLTQVHGTAVAAADTAEAVPRADAWAGAPDPGVLLTIRTADCLPVLLHAPGSRQLGLAHAGWRGAVAGVAERTVAAMGVPPADIQALLGPCIGPCCYQVGEAVVERLGSDHPRLTPWPGEPNRYAFHLAGFVRDRLREAGLGAAQIEQLDLCTACRTDLFFSYRAEGHTGRMLAFLGWQGAVR